jgi:type VII secretion integral membrane protein EccD
MERRMDGALSRVTIVAPRTRIDVALPADVPLADLLPTLLEFTAGGEDPAGRTGWGLSRLGTGELDSSRTPAQLQVRDGELLYLRPRGEHAPAAIYDDLVDAIATGTRERPGRWSAATTRSVALTAAVLALVAGVVAVPFTGPPYPLDGYIALGLAVALLVVAAVFARAVGDARTGTAFALIATVYATVGGLLVLAGSESLGTLTQPHLAVAATAATTAAALGSIAVPGAARVFLSLGLAAVAVLLTMTVAAGFDIPVAAAAAVTVSLAYATLPLMPMVAYRIAGLPAPSVPSEKEAAKNDPETIDAVTVLDQSRRADGFLTAMVTALAFVSGGTAILVALAGPSGRGLALVLGLLSLLRARWFAGRAARLALLTAGVVALAAVAAAEFGLVDRTARLASILAVTIGVTGAAIAYGLTGTDRPGSPIWGRFLDVLEVVLILALVPLAVMVSGVYDWIRAIRG